MIKNRISTKEQLVGSITSLLIVSSILLGLLLLRYSYVSQNIDYLGIASFLFAVPIMMILVQFMLWYFENARFTKGLKYALKHSRDRSSIRRQFIDAGIYIKKTLFNVEVALLPHIEIEYSEDFQEGLVKIKKNIKYGDKLEKINISPALKDYVIEQIYTTTDGKHSIHKFCNHKIERKNIFNNFQDYQNHAKSQLDYEISIDKRVKIPLSHSLIVGQTRSGKSYMLLVSILQMLCKQLKYHLYFIDPKISSIGLVGSIINPDDTAEEYDQIVLLLEKFVNQMQERKKIMRKQLVNKIDGDYRSFKFSPHILIFDEYASFSIMLKNKSKDERNKINDLISEIVLQGSQLGFFIWIVMQKSDSQNIPTAVRDNLMFKLVLGNAEEQTYVTTFGNADIPNYKFDLGEGVYTYPGITVNPSICSISTLNFDINKAFTEMS